jgi:Ca2+-binding RTX toxin-like protein
MAVTATFANGALIVFGDDDANAITISRNLAGEIFVNGGDIVILGETPTVTNTALIQIIGLDGNDTIKLDETNGALPPAALSGNNGEDTILGGNDDDTLFGDGVVKEGDGGNDFFDGNKGDDTAFMGPGNDVFQWDPGDGSDVVHGDDGTDTMLFNGNGANEIFNVSENDGRAIFTRDVGNIVMDLDSVEQITLNALGGADTLTINDLTGTGVRTIAVNLAGTPGGDAGDGAVDTVIANGSNSNERISVVGEAGGTLTVNGLAARLFIRDSEAFSDRLTLDGGRGDDVIDASRLAAGQMNLTINGGFGADVLVGSDADDLFAGGDGNDVALMGGGNDTFVWNAADDNDTIDGQDGTDTVQFNSLGTDESISISALGEFARLFRDNGGIFLHMSGVERIDIDAGEGENRVVIDDLSSTDVELISINTGSQSDFIDGSHLAINTKLVVQGGAGNDVLLGGAGEDTAVFNVDFNTVEVVFEDGTLFIQSAEGRDEVSGIENLQFTDGTIRLNDGNPLVNDLFYFAANRDVWDAGIDADDHYNAVGWLEGRDPSASFSTNGYLSANADVRAAHINPLLHFDQVGWREGRDPSAGFDIQVYLEQNPDVAAAGINPLAHFEVVGRAEGRDAFPAIGHVNHEGFDAEFYLLGNPDVGFAGVDPFFHYRTVGFHEGRDPNAFFDTEGYLAAYGDVAAVGIDPLAHYMSVGVHEGRDPSGAFDTAAYLAANPDVAAAGVNPLLHFLNSGVHEGRLPLGDGIFA